MRLSGRVKPISYLKAHATEILEALPDEEPLIVTVRGEAKAVLMDITEYEETQREIALLKKLLRSEEDLREGRVRPYRDVFADLRKRKRR